MKRIEHMASDIAANNPQASIGPEIGVLLVDFLKRLMDCLFNRFGTAGATDEEFPEPLQIEAADDWIEKARKVKARVADYQSHRPAHVREWGGYRPAGVRRMRVTLLRTAREKGQRMSVQEATQHSIATLDKVDAMSTEDLAATLQEESAT